MNGTFDAVEFVSYIRVRWLVPALSCAVAVALAFGVSRLLPRRYTATASVLIRPPGGSDPRTATAVSPVYLESLKAYETFASSDTVFVKAIAAVNASSEAGKASPAASKRRILKVSKPASTALLEISATLKDPVKAQALAQNIAEQTVALNGALNAESSAELNSEFRAQLSTARERLEKARQARAAVNAGQALSSLDGEVQEMLDLKFRLERDLELARTDLADYTGQRSDSNDDASVRRQIASAQAKIAALTSQIRDLSDNLARNGPQLDQRRAHVQALEDEERAALTAFETANTRLNEMLSASQTRGERLQIIDPGIIPGQPSSPDTLLNVVAAFLVAFAGSMIFLAFQFSHSRLITTRAERAYSLR
jgi:succinoglycan biosynthesis transport protein ExoP